jgi:hypothetical protein
MQDLSTAGPPQPRQTACAAYDIYVYLQAASDETVEYPSLLDNLTTRSLDR